MARAWVIGVGGSKCLHFTAAPEAVTSNSRSGYGDPASPMSGAEVFPHHVHALPSQAAFTWAEAFIYYLDHLPQVEEFGERT